MNPSNSVKPTDKSLFTTRWKLAEKLISIKRNIEFHYVEYKGEQLKLHLRSDERYKYVKCRYCGQLIAYQKFEEYVIENENTALPFWRRNHRVKMFWIAWDINPVDHEPCRKHVCCYQEEKEVLE